MREKMSMSEAGKLGAIAAREQQEYLKIKRIQEYNKNPKRCPSCQEPLEYKNHNNRTFCSQSCSASYNNKLKHIMALENRPNCKMCNKKCKNLHSSWCSTTCMQNHVWQQKKVEIENTKVVTGIVQARRYLTETQGHKCAISHCGISEWHGHPVLLICDHINGNSDDWSLENLRLICSNCDAQTPFYKARNKGNGRHSRRERYKEGKSY